MQRRTTKTTHANFAFRAKMGDYEIEISGTREEVLKTIEDLQRLMSIINKAFENIKPKKVTTLTVKTEPAKEEKVSSQKYPTISPTESYDKAVLRLLETDWGKWRPRTIDELRDAFRANGIEYPGRRLSTILTELVKNGKIRRWNTDAGNVYILAEKESFGLRREANG